MPNVVPVNGAGPIPLPGAPVAPGGVAPAGKGVGIPAPPPIPAPQTPKPLEIE
jgi:hypothetical protein